MRCLGSSTQHDADAAGGVFRQAYTQSFHDRFFFELCERDGGYAGFGAANAAVRMAAQQREAGGSGSV